MNNFHSELKTLKTPENCPAMTWKLGRTNGDGDFDKEILPLLKNLNNEKWHTVASCAGHNLEDIAQHNMGYTIDSPYRIVLYIHVHIDSIEAFKLMMDEMSEVSDYFLCELGYFGSELSNHTEEQFLPFYIQVFCGTKEWRDTVLKKLVKISAKYSK
jgi:hypothetical protein